MSRHHCALSQGILLLDKPSGLSSNQALSKVKGIFKIRKAGHTGSLDPLASGMLPICFGEATKFARFLLEADKSYHVVAKLGETTTTGDSEGDIVDRQQVPALTTSTLAPYLEKFTGEIEQKPSMFSALKHQGKPLYHYARKGIEIDRPTRRIHIKSLQLEGIHQRPGQTTLSLVVTCSKGTYIRTLVEDLGQVLGCGAHVVALRRLWVGGFKQQPMLSLGDLRQAEDPKAHCLPIALALNHLPEITLSESMATYVLHGQKVRISHHNIGWVSLKNHLGEFIGMGEYLDDGRLAPRRMLQTNHTALQLEA